MNRKPPRPRSKQLCKDLFAAAERQGITNTQLAFECGVNVRTVMGALGNGALPHGKKLHAIADRLGVVIRATENVENILPRPK